MTGNIPDTVVILRDQAEELRVPTVSATIQLSETESESWVHETEVRDEGWGLKCRQGELRVSSKER